jgi:hypothetical protein
LDKLNQVTYEVNQRVQSHDTTFEDVGTKLLRDEDILLGDANRQSTYWREINGLEELGGIKGMRDELDSVDERIRQVYTDVDNDMGTLGREINTVIRVANEAVEISKNARRLKKELSKLQDEINFEEKLDRSEEFKDLYEKAEKENEIMKTELQPTLKEIINRLRNLRSTFETVIEELENHTQLSEEFIDKLQNETSQSSAPRTVANKTKAGINSIVGEGNFMEEIVTLADNVVNITNNLHEYDNTGDLIEVLGSSRSGEDGCIYDILTGINDKAKKLEQGLDEEYKKDSEKIQNIEEEYQELENILSG